MKPDYIALSIPFFFLLIAIEILIDLREKRHLYRFNDAITNISLGIGQQVTGIFIKAFILFGYVYLYEMHRLTTIHETVLNWILLFVGVDFFYYWFHRMSHEVNALWAAHIVHHQSEDYNLSVALRQSWLQSLFSWVFYLPLALLGFDPVMFLTVSSFNTIYQFWIHTQTIKKLGPLEYVFNTPSHHRVHHGSNQKYLDKNHGGTLIIWDRLFGTFQEEEDDVVYGITKPLNSWNPVWANLHYWVELFDSAAQRITLREKIHVFFKKPAAMLSVFNTSMPASTLTAKTFKKYNLHVDTNQRWYVLAQFTTALFIAVLILFKGSSLSTMQLFVIAFFILWTLVCCGGILDRKVWYFNAELIRISMGLILPVVFILENYFESLYLFMVVYVLISGIWFYQFTQRKRIGITKQ
jgi:sterol desaturase/sphingolipid hydroxylase (fatty acid hydroxylase superfamily)